jgi:hypothetical protein
MAALETAETVVHRQDSVGNSSNRVARFEQASTTRFGASPVGIVILQSHLEKRKVRCDEIDTG